jgi:hypothetical protein
MSLYHYNIKRWLLGNYKKRKNSGENLAISALDQQNAYHRVDLKKGTKPMTIFIPGPFWIKKRAAF